MPRGQQLPERAQELRDVVKMQPGGRLVEQQQLFRRRADVRQVACELETLCFSTRERQATETQVFEADDLEVRPHADRRDVAEEVRALR